VEDLRLSFNSIANVSPLTFNNLTNLNNLDLYWNQIVSLDRDAFAGTSQIKELNLGVNLFKSLVNASTLFAQLKYLEKLSLFNNQIDYVNASVFKGLNSLKSLDLFGNKLRMLDDKLTFAEMTQLESIDLRTNNITSIHSGIFVGLKSLEYVKLEYNPICNTNLTYVCSLCSANDKCIISTSLSYRCPQTPPISSSNQMKYSRLSLILIVFAFVLF
jgi:Leucine-rich repeat (LRR) protein